MTREIPRSRPKVLGPRFFRRDAETVARGLIGKTLVRCLPLPTRFTVTEAEAYVGVHDLACHAAKGRTARTEVMFGPAGVLYVYLIYGMYWMLNVVTGEVGEGAAVLIRGVAGVDGPGRVTRALAIDRGLNGLPAMPKTGLWFEDAGEVADDRIGVTPRIGVAYAGPVWAAAPLRFVLAETEARPRRKAR